MPYTIITTCGTSLLETSCWDHTSYPNIKGLPARGKADSKADEYRNILECRNFIDGNKNETLANYFYMDCWNDGNPGMWGKMSAELYSLRMIFEQKKLNEERWNNEGHQLWLLHSQDKDNDPQWCNHDGNFCAQITKKILIEEIVLRNVNLKGFNYLDPDHTEFLNSLKGLTSFVNKIYRTRGNNEIILNLTGGYKIMGMVLSGLTAFYAPTPSRIFYLYESSKTIFDMNWLEEEGCLKLDKKGLTPAEEQFIILPGLG